MNDNTSRTGVQIGDTQDGSTTFGISHQGLTVIVDHYPDGDMVLLVEKDGLKEIWEMGVRGQFKVYDELAEHGKL